MTLRTDLSKVLTNPRLIGKAPGTLAARWAGFLIRNQVRHQAASLDTSGLSREHYAWSSMTEQFAWDVFCIQETNLVNFVKSFASDSCDVAVEIGAASDVFLRNVKAREKLGVNVLDACVEQLNRQGITGVKSDGQKIPLKDNAADLTICFETLEHARDPLLFLSELNRITRKKLLLSIPWVVRTNIRARWYGKASPDQPDSEYHVFEFDEVDFARLLSYTDFKVSAYRKLTNYRAKYDPFTNWCLRKYMYLSYFPAIQAYVLEKRGQESGA